MGNQRLIDDGRARLFIKHYQAVLTEIAVLTGVDAKAVSGKNVFNMLHAARAQMQANPELYPQALAILEKRKQAIPEELLQTFGTLRVSRWVYLRDTTSYSVFLDTSSEQDAAYAVKCLTSNLKEILGDSGAIIECGLLIYEGQIITDGLLGFAAWIGPNYRSSFNQRLSELRASGQFYKDRLMSESPSKLKSVKKSKTQSKASKKLLK